MATDPSESSGDASEAVSLKQRFPEDSPRSTKQSKNKKTKTGECICTICRDPILDATKTSEGQDSIFCEDRCSAWIHRQCAGLTKSVFDVLAKSEVPFHCPHCTLQNHASEKIKLKEVIESLTESITQLKVASEKLTTSQNQTTSKDSMSQPPTESQTRTSEPLKQTASDRKFNIAMYGV